MGTGGTSAPKTPDVQFSFEVLLPNDKGYYIIKKRNVNPFFEYFSKKFLLLLFQHFYNLADVYIVVI